MLIRVLVEILSILLKRLGSQRENKFSKVSFKNGYLILNIDELSDKCKGYGALVLRNIPISLLASDDEVIMNYTKRLTELLLNANAEIALIILPERLLYSEVLKRIESEISRLSMLLVLDQTNPKVRNKLELLERMYKRLLSGDKPLKITLLFLVGIISPCKDILNRMENTMREMSFLIRQYMDVNITKINMEKLFGIPVIIDRSIIMGRFSIMVLGSTLGSFLPINRVYRDDYHINNIDNSIYIGIDMDTQLPIFIDIDKYFVHHFIVSGPTGKGKTTLLATLVLQLIETDKNVVVIDFKGDLANILTHKNIPITDIDIEELINLEVSEDIELLSKWFMEISSIFGEIFNISNTEKYGIYKILISSYRTYGKINIDKLLTIIRRSSKGHREVLYIADLINELRIKSTRKSTELGSQKRFTVISLKGYPEKMKQLIASIILVKEFLLNMSLNKYNGNKLNKIIVIDEAWRLTKHGLSTLSRLYREGRRFGLGLISSTQLLDDLPSSIIENTSNMVIFGYNSDEYIDKISEYIPLTKREKQRLKTLNVGEALLKLKNTRTPFWVRIDASNVISVIAQETKYL